MIICKSEAELRFMREAGRIVAETHRLMAASVRAGITTRELDDIAIATFAVKALFRRLKATINFLAAFALLSTKNWCTASLDPAS